MAVRYTTFPESNFSGGIDARSAENQIAPGYVSDLLNGEVVEGRVRKRRGYQGHAGNIPFRVSQVEYENTANRICFTLDESIDLSATYSTPIVVYGRTSSTITTGGPFTNTTDAAKYYAGFTIESRKSLTASAGLPVETLEVNNTEHNIDTTNMFVQVVESTSTTNRSHRLVDVDAIQVDESTYDLDIDYQNSTGADITSYVYYKDKTVTAGSAYTATLSHTGSGSEVFNIAAATHGLSNYNLIVRVQEDLGSEREFIVPDSLTIDTAGQVSITINWTGAAKTYYAILSTTNTSNSTSGTVNASSTGSITISSITSPWVFLSVYLEQTPGGTKEQVLPNDIQYNDTTQQLTVEFVNGSSSATNFFIYYEYGTIRANTICVDESTISVDATDTRPQLTIWGLDHSEAYGTATLSLREGWVTHIDSYKRSGESRLIAGLGGNIFRSRTYSEDGTAYLYAKLYPRLQARTSASRTVGPCFHVTGATPARTRGYITGGNVTSNLASVTSVTYDSANTWTKYVLSFTSMAILDSSAVATTIGNVISTTTDLEDYLTVTQMSSSRHEGTFKIKQVTSGSNVVNIWVENSSISSTDWDDTGVGGSAGINSDRLVFLANSPFLASDIITNPNITGASLTITTKSSSTTSMVATGYTSTITIPGGVVTLGARSSSVVALRGAIPSTSASTTNLVRGDMLSYTGIDRLLRVNFINPDSDRTVNITADGTTATVTLTTGDTDYLHVGGKVLLLFAGTYSGVQAITEVPTTTTFKFTTTASTTVNSATLIGSTMEVDETLSWADTESDTKSFRIERRWIPVEAPDDSYGLTPSTYIRHLDSGNYNNQSTLRSVMVLDNMYFSNQADENYKFDGTNLYRAGLIPWQPALFASVDTTNSAKIVAGNATTTPSAVNSDVFTVTIGEETKFPVGSRVKFTGTTGSGNYDVIESWAPGTGSNGFVKVLRTSTSAFVLGGSPSLTRLSVRRYYMRLNAIDANSNIIASAVTSSEDMVVELAADSAIRLKAVGLPAWDVYDYDRLDVEIYGTKLNTEAPFYRISTIQMDFNNTQGYVNYTDVYSDDQLYELDQTSTLKVAPPGQPVELGTSWSDALRAKYTTSLGNRLVLANIKDYPQLDIQLIADGSVTATTYAGKKFTFRKSDTSTDTVTDMVNECVYEFVNGTTNNTTAFTIGASSFTVTCTSLPGATAVGDWVYLTYSTTNQVTDTFNDANVTIANPGVITLGVDHGFINGDQIQLTAGSAALPTGYSAATTYYVVARTTTTIQLSLTSGGAGIEVTAVGVATGHTIAKQNDLTYAGWWQISAVSGSDITVNLTGLAAATAYPNKYVTATDPTDIPVLLGTDGNLGMINGDSLDLFDTMRRMSLAINASMRMCDTTISGMTTFTPWMIARGGNDVGAAGRLVVRQPRVDSTTMEVLLPSSFTGSSKTFKVFINGVRKAVATETSASTRLYPSRILLSYENYPELYDNPTAVVDLESDSAIDINSSDGQEITGVIPFFGESAFGASQQAGIIVVFKQNSIYLVDINEKVKQIAGIPGANPVQRIETEGLGCTAPYSIASTKGGIMFANESGIYCLRRNLTIQYLGKYMDRNWVDTIDLTQLAIVQGHSYGLGRQYKVAVPLADATRNSLAYVYDHTPESEGRVGPWYRFNNHPATGWANLAPDAFFGSTQGRVLSIRRNGTADDYRDSSTAISFRLDTRHLDFGDAGIRKTIGNILVHYRVGARNTGTTLSTNVDTETTFRSTTAPIIPVASTGTYVAQGIVTVAHSTDRRRGNYLQIRIANSTLDEDLEIAGIDIRVAGLDERGIMDAAQSRLK